MCLDAVSRVQDGSRPEASDARSAEAGVHDESEILTADEVADLLRLDRKTVYTAAKQGSLPCLRFGRVLRFCRKAVLDSVAQGRVAPARGGT